MSHLIEQIRAQFQAADDIRDVGLQTPEDIERYDDIPYGEDPVWQSLDVYRPRTYRGQTLPVIVSVHGGAWVYGNKKRYQYYCMQLALQGFAVVNFTYRLAPEFQFPASLEDTNLVIRWVFQHSAQYRLDTRRIFAVGDSAGAHILGLYTALCTDPDFASQFSFAPPADFVPTGIALNCGVYHCPHKENDLTTSLLSELLPGKGTPSELEQINVLHHVNPAFPPVFLMTAAGDFFQEDALLLAQALIHNNVPFQFHFYGDSGNILGHVFHCNIRLPAADRCNRATCDFFKELI